MTTTDPELAAHLTDSFDQKSTGMVQFRLHLTTAGMVFTSEPFSRAYAHEMIRRHAYWPSNIPGANYITGSDETGTNWMLV